MGKKTSKLPKSTSRGGNRGAEDLQSVTLTALRGVQAGREYFVTMFPLRLIPRLTIFDEGELPAPLRAQRVLNKARVPEIASYLAENPKDYVFSSITVSVDGELTFEPFADSGPQSKFGHLAIPLSAKILINDGQHRRAGIEEALKETPELGDETISVVIFQDAGLRRSQQMFADLNRHAIRPTKSLGVLYDHRDPFSGVTRDVMEQVDMFRSYTELEKTTISNRSTKIFTLNGIFQATKALLGKQGKRVKASPDDLKVAVEYWSAVSETIPEWQQLLKKEVSPTELRREYIHAHGVVLQALGHAGNALLNEHPKDWRKRLEPLRSIDWSKNNVELWEGRAMTNGRVSKAKSHILRTTILIKQTLDLTLSEEEKKTDREFPSPILVEA